MKESEIVDFLQGKWKSDNTEIFEIIGLEVNKNGKFEKIKLGIRDHGIYFTCNLLEFTDSYFRQKDKNCFSLLGSKTSSLGTPDLKLNDNERIKLITFHRMEL